MRVLRRSQLAWAAAVVLALGTARTVAVGLGEIERRSAALGPPVTVVVAATDLAVGTDLDAAAVRTVLAAASLVPPDALDDTADVVGRTVALPVPAGAVVTAAHLGAGTTAVAPGQRLVRVVADGSVRPAPGDVVDVIGATIGPDGTAQPEVVAGVTALGVEEASGTLPDALAVLLLVPEDDAPRLAVLAGAGPLTLALAPAEERCCRRSPSEPSRD